MSLSLVQAFGERVADELDELNEYDEDDAVSYTHLDVYKRQPIDHLLQLGDLGLEHLVFRL